MFWSDTNTLGLDKLQLQFHFGVGQNVRWFPPCDWQFGKWVGQCLCPIDILRPSRYPQLFYVDHATGSWYPMLSFSVSDSSGEEPLPAKLRLVNFIMYYARSIFSFHGHFLKYCTCKFIEIGKRLMSPRRIVPLQLSVQVCLHWDLISFYLIFFVLCIAWTKFSKWVTLRRGNVLLRGLWGRSLLYLSSLFVILYITTRNS